MDPSLERMKDAARKACGELERCAKEMQGTNSFKLVGNQLFQWWAAIHTYLVVLDSAPKPKKLTSGEKDTRIRELEKQVEQLQKDCSDMGASLCTTFERCRKCKTLHDKNYVCKCGFDNSDLGYEEQS